MDFLKIKNKIIYNVWYIASVHYVLDTLLGAVNTSKFPVLMGAYILTHLIGRQDRLYHAKVRQRAIPPNTKIITQGSRKMQHCQMKKDVR